MAIDSALVAAAASATNFSPLLTTVGFSGLVTINWDKINVAYHDVLSMVTNTITNSSTASGGIGGNHTATASFLPTTMMMNLGIPLTGSTALGFAIGIMKG